MGQHALLLTSGLNSTIPATVAHDHEGLLVLSRH